MDFVLKLIRSAQNDSKAMASAPAACPWGGSVVHPTSSWGSELPRRPTLRRSKPNNIDTELNIRNESTGLGTWPRSNTLGFSDLIPEQMTCVCSIYAFSPWRHTLLLPQSVLVFSTAPD